MPHKILRSRWCDIIVQNVHAPKEDKTDDMKDSLHEKLERVFDKFRRVGKMFSNPQLGKRVHMKFVMIMELQQ
jgi:hypothetical protein